MKISKLVLAGALGAFMFTAAQAAPVVGPASSVAVGLVQKAAETKKAAPKKAMTKKAAPKKVAKKKAAPKKMAKKPAKKKVAKVGPGKCGAMNYYSKKSKKCETKG
jgi:uncharacterized protein YdbL (DUF1318 family)